MIYIAIASIINWCIVIFMLTNNHIDVLVNQILIDILLVPVLINLQNEKYKFSYLGLCTACFVFCILINISFLKQAKIIEFFAYSINDVVANKRCLDTCGELFVLTLAAQLFPDKQLSMDLYISKYFAFSLFICMISMYWGYYPEGGFQAGILMGAMLLTLNISIDLSQIAWQCLYIMIFIYSIFGYWNILIFEMLTAMIVSSCIQKFWKNSICSI